VNNIIIFGGCGFIGSHLIKYLNSIGLTPIVCDIVKEPILKNLEYKYIYVDVRKTINIDISMYNISTIFNLAAISKSPGHKKYEYYDTNIKGAQNVCNFARNNKINKIVFTSTIAVYGFSEKPCFESNILNADSDYGKSKIEAENIHSYWLEESENKELLILRPAVVYGLYENSNFHRLYKAIKMRLFFYPGRKDTLKSCIYVKDFVSLSYKLINEGKCKNKGKSKVINMCYENAFSIEEISKSIAKVCNCRIPFIIIPSKVLLLLAFIVNKITINKIGFHPDRVKKIMYSTNVSGEKLAKLGYKLGDFDNSIKDWFNDSGKKGLL